MLTDSTENRDTYMSVGKRITGLVATIGLLVGGFILTAGTAMASPVAEVDTAQVGSAATTSAKPVAWDARTGEALGQWDCKKGRVCFWKGEYGTGKRCMWGSKDPNWLGVAVQCSRSDTAHVRSVWNRKGGFEGVVYYYDTRYGNRIGCTKPGMDSRGNLAGTYAPRSHRWTEGSCG